MGGAHVGWVGWAAGAWSRAGKNTRVNVGCVTDGPKIMEVSPMAMKRTRSLSCLVLLVCAAMVGCGGLRHTEGVIRLHIGTTRTLTNPGVVVYSLDGKPIAEEEILSTVEKRLRNPDNIHYTVIVDSDVKWLWGEKDTVSFLSDMAHKYGATFVDKTLHNTFGAETVMPGLKPSATP